MSEVEESVLFFLANTREGRMVLQALAAFCYRMAQLGTKEEEQKPEPQQQQYPIMRV